MIIFEKKMMKQIILLAFILVIQISVYSDEDERMQKLEIDSTIGTNLDFYLFSPLRFGSDVEKRPLVFVLHGCSQGVTALSKQSGWNDLASKHGFFVLYVQQKKLNNMMGCFNWFSRHHATKDKGELGAMKKVLDDVIVKQHIDLERVFVYGLSAGAMMSVSLMVCYPEMFCMGAVLAGGPYVLSENSSVTPASLKKMSRYTDEELYLFVRRQNVDYQGDYPRLVVFHGENDKVVNLRNSDALIRQWSLLYSRDTIITTEESQFASHPDIYRYMYSDSLGNVFAIYYKVKNLGHKMMVHPGEGERKGGQIGMFSIDKSFFSTYYIAKDFGLIDEKSGFK